MEFTNSVKRIADSLPLRIAHIQTEEATKNAFVMPFVQALGYDVFNPLEFTPEFCADVGVKKGEKVDYVIKKDGKIVVLIECKAVGVSLTLEHASQLYRYFSVTDSRFAVLTNGIVYHFYSDIDEPNKMDKLPFFRFDLANYDEQDIENLRKFTKDNFNIDSIISVAGTLKYFNAVKKALTEEFVNPSEDFVRLLIAKTYEGKITQGIKDKFQQIVKDALSNFIKERVSDRLKSALQSENEKVSTAVEITKQENVSGIETTQEETDAFNIVRAILSEVVDIERIYIRDTKSYCGVLLDDNNRKPICRFHFNYSQKYIGVFKEKVEERIAISSAKDIFMYSKKIKETVREYATDEQPKELMIA
ncbi:MAG: restriction endonuclease [Rickettsiales bacterium]|jgi:hypothetical protein|nr:restriction endonuclease [Rickettsiales bacterium]